MSTTAARKPVPLRRQRGIITAMAAVILITAVLYVLVQSLGIIGKTSQSNQSQGESIAAFFVAESGVEYATTKLAAAAASGNLSGGDCTGLAPTTGTLGTGLSFTVDSATSYDQTGAEAPGCTGAACARCKVQVTGTAARTGDTAKRTLEFELLTKTSNGSCGFGGKEPKPVSLSLTNPTSLPTLGFFSIGWRVNGNDGPQAITSGNTDASCTVGNCLAWLVKSSGGGSVSAGNLGALVQDIPIGAPSNARIAMPITQDRPYSAIGILFEPRPNFGSSPQIVNKGFWDDKNGSSTATVANATAGLVDLGQVNSGVVNNTGTCDSPPTTTTGAGFTGSKQTCNSWCSGGDTIVMGLSGKSGATGDQTDVSFNSVRMKRAVHLPLTANECPAYTPPDVYSEIHYLYNADYTSSANSASSGGTFNATVGIPALTAQISAGAPGAGTMSVPNTYAFGSRKLFIGDKIYCTGNAGACSGIGAGVHVATVSGFPTTGSCTQAVGCAVNGPGGGNEYSVTRIVTLANNTATNFEVRSIQMHAEITSGWLSVGDQLATSGGTLLSRTIAGVPCLTSGIATCNTTNSVYQINLETIIPAGTGPNPNPLHANGYTLHVSGGGTIADPNSSGTLTNQAPVSGTVLAVRAGTGVLPASACVVNASPAAPAVFQIGTLQWNGSQNVCNPNLPQIASTRLDNATLCGGTCGLFNAPGSTTSETDFLVTRNNSGTTQWAAGFACIKGIDPAKNPTVVTSSSTSSQKWHEVVR